MDGPPIVPHQTHEFSVSLGRSCSPDLQGHLDEAYLSVFRVTGDIVTDECWQRAGVDRTVYTSHEGQRVRLLVEDKVRSRRDTSDVLLELFSSCRWDHKRGAPKGPATPGWAVDPDKISDRLLYVWAPAGKLLWFDYPRLRTYAVRMMPAWMGRPGWAKIAENGRYQTVNVAVPSEDLVAHVGARWFDFPAWEVA